jgi:alpha-tubulin suppressor-like RCC1 family protein
VSCWGSNSRGVLGVGQGPFELPSSDVPLRTSLANVVELALSAHACARHADGTVSCWGENITGEIGDGSTTPRSAPVPVVGLTNATQISTATGRTCALRSTGAPVCWGWSGGQWGGDPAGFTTPTPISALYP